MTDRSDLPIVQWARDYASLGWKVFPVSPDKTPLTAHGFKDASADLTQINAWWTQYPQAGIGVATGEVSGIVVLDVDLEKPGTEESLRELVRQRGALAQDVVARSGGGGWHFYFRHPSNGIKVPNVQRLLGLTGIDVRGDGGYIIAPPSLHKSGNFYEWGQNQSPFDTAPPVSPDFLYSGTRQSFSLQYSDQIPEGSRNATLASIAGMMRSLGFDEPTILDLLKRQNLMRCHPPLPDAEVETIAHHVAMYPPHPNRQGETTGQVDLDQLLRFEQSDTGYAEMIAFVNMGRIKYNHSTGKFFLWDRHWWQADQTMGIYDLTRRVVDRFKESIRLVTEEERQAELTKWARQMNNKSRLESAISLVRSLPTVVSVDADWDRHPYFLGVKNGIIDLRSGILRDGHPQDYISKHVAMVYDPSAKCPTWLKFLEDVFVGDRDVIRFVQKAVGYSMTGETREQCLMLLVGNGSNGKSIFLSTLLALTGGYGFAAPFSTFVRSLTTNPNSNDLASLSGRRFVTASETNEGVALDESRLKSLTGGEVISARFLHQEYFQFTPICKIWLGVNHLPRVHDDSDGFWRRVRQINFPVKFKKAEDAKPGDRIRDETIGPRLLEELPGILAWAVQGAVSWYESSLPTPKAIQEATLQYRQDSDPLAEFFDLHCIRGATESCDSSELFKAYLGFARIKLLKQYEILSSTRFHGRLARDFQRDQSNGSRRYLGISLKPESQAQLSQAESGGMTIVFKNQSSQT